MSRERKERMWDLALRLARSGDHIGWWSIEKELEDLGFSAARQWLGEEDRERLGQLCAEALKERFAGAAKDEK